MGFPPMFLVLALLPTAGPADDSLLERDVLPILTRQCLGCHGGLRQKGGLDLRTVPLMLRGGDSGPALKASNAGASEMWKQIEAGRMPPHEKKLTDAEKSAIRRWIDAGLPTLASRQKDPPLLPADRKHEPAQVADAIDRAIGVSLTAAQLQPSAPADDAEFLRRAYLDLTGRIPTAEQAKAFLEENKADRRTRLIDELLATPQFGEQFGRTWREWISPPELPSDANGGKQPVKETQALGVWFGSRFTAGDGWDRIVRDLLTVDGEIKTRPQVIFFGLVGEGGKITPAGSTRAVASLFLGMQLQCAECHDDPYKAWAQKEYWSLAAFFSKTTGDFNKVTEGSGKGPAQIAIPKTAFKNVGTMVPANFPGGKPFPTGTEESLRKPFVDWLTARDNPYFARAFANRMWFYFFSRGIVHPIDDFRELNPPSNPVLMSVLGNEFAASGYDIKHLIRCICNSQAYQRTSRLPEGTTDARLAGLNATFGRIPLRVMSADVLFDSLKLATGDPKLDLRAIDPRDGNTNGESAPVGDPYIEFLRRFGTNEEDATDFTHGIPQLLTMINHPRLLAGNKNLETLLKSKPAMAPEAVVEWLYLGTLSRRPTREELADAMAYFKKTTDPSRAYAGVLWMLVNRSEFLFVR